jgi:hypothetical protein
VTPFRNSLYVVSRAARIGALRLTARPAAFHRHSILVSDGSLVIDSGVATCARPPGDDIHNNQWDAVHAIEDSCPSQHADAQREAQEDPGKRCG